MEFKVKEVGSPENKSKQEIEEQLLESSEQVNEEVDNSNEEVNEEVDNVTEEIETSELKEEDVLSFIKNKYKKDLTSFDELFTEKKEELPEDVSAFLNYKKETGRGIDDFMKIQKDYDSVDENQLLREFYKETEKGLDDDDIDYLMEKFSFDEELDDDKDIKRAKIEKKKEIAKAKEYFNGLKDKYKAPVEQAATQDEGYEEYKQYIKEAETIQQENAKRNEFFRKETEKIFNDEFKGFEFKVGDSNIVFKPGDSKELMQRQSDISNFISKYLDDNGMIKDASAYHKALSAAMNPDRLAQYFYEKGQSDATKDYSKESKNIDMSVRSTPQQHSVSGLKVKAVETKNNDFKIRKR